MSIVLRYNKVAFFGVPDEGNTTVTYTRMHGFSDMSESKNVTTYDRRYVDKKSNDVDVTGYAPSISFTFDEHRGDTVCEDIAGIIDNEKIGADAVRSVVVVDFTQPESDGFRAYKRDWSIVGDSVGSGTDAFAYSGTLNSKSEAVWGVAKVKTPAGGNNETAEVITFTEDSE